MNFKKPAGLVFFLFPTLALAFTLTTSSMKGWDKNEVKFRFNTANCSIDAGRIENAIQQAVDLWNSVPTSRLKVSYSGQTTASGDTDEPIINCVTSGISGSVGVGYIGTISGVIVQGRIELNSEAGDTGNITNTNDAQLAIALAHEMGHIFGLGHSTAESSLMYFSLGNKQRLSLSQDDMDGITWLYPRSEPGDGVMGCGSLSAGGPGSGSGLLWILAGAGLVALGLRSRKEPLAA